MKKYRTIWAYLYMPIIFLVFGYATVFVVLAPVIQFVTSSIDIILLNEAPTFNKEDGTSASPENKRDEKIKEEKEAELAKPSTESEPTSIPSTEITYPAIGNEYGQIIIDKINLDTNLSFGDRPEDLRVGAGQYSGSVFPGEIGTSLIGGHNTSDFGRLNLLEVGDTIIIKTNYGTYTYTMTDKKVAQYDEPTAIESLFIKEGHKLILYTCYPVDMIGLTDERLFVYADLVSGPLVDENK